MNKFGSLAAALLLSAALVSCGGGDSSPPSGGGPKPAPSPSPSPSPSPTPTPISYTKFHDISGLVSLKTACFTVTPFGNTVMPSLVGPEAFGQHDALTYDGTALSVAIKTPGGLEQSWTGEQRANKADKGVGPWDADQDQYHWTKPTSNWSQNDGLTMFVPYYGSVGEVQLNRYSRSIVATMVGQGTVPAITHCATGTPTVAADLPTGSKSYPDIDMRWSRLWKRDSADTVQLVNYWTLDADFRMDANFAARTVSFDIAFPEVLGETYGPFTGTGSIGDNGEIAADLEGPAGTLMIRGSFFGPGAGEFVIIYALAEDYDNDGTNDLVFMGPVGGRE